MSCVYIKSISLYVHMSVCLLDPSDQNWSSNWAHQTQGCLANSWLTAWTLNQRNTLIISRIWKTRKGFVTTSATVLDDDDEACRWPQGCIWGLKSEEAYSPTPPSLPPLEKWRNTAGNMIWRKKAEENMTHEMWSWTPPYYSISRKVQNTIWNTIVEKHLQLQQIFFAMANLQCPEDKYLIIQSCIV